MSDYQIPYASEMGPEYQPKEQKTFAERTGDALHSAAYSGLQSPVTGILEIVDKTAGTELAPNIQFVQNPEEAETFSVDWHIKHAASAAGMILPFMLARKGAKGLLRSNADDILRLNGGMAKHWRSLAVKEGALSGFIYEAALVPTHNLGGDGFLEARMKQGLVGAATFGTLTKASIGTRSITSGLAKSSNTALFLDNSVAATTLAGIPAGLVSANSSSLLNEGRLASSMESVESAYAMAFVGLSLSAAHQLSVTEALTGPAPKTGTLRNGITDLLDRTQISQGLASVKEGAQVRLRGAREAMEAFADNLTIGSSPYGQYAFATAGNGSRAPFMMMEASPNLNAARPLRMEAQEITGGTRGRVTKPSHEVLRGEKSEGLDGEVIRETGRPNTVKAGEVLRYHSLREVAEFVESKKSWRDLEVNPENVFFGNDALLVVEVKPSAKHPNGAMLKVVAPEGGWEYDWGHRPGDAKLRSKVEQIDMDSGNGTAYLYLQELVDVRSRYETHLLDEYFRNIEGKELSFEEPGPNPNKQFGISQTTGKLVLIDYPSVGKPGHMRTLTELTQGAEFFEREYDAENFGRRDSESEVEFDRLKDFDNSERDMARQRLKETRQLDETQRDILEQLSSGITPKEAAEYLALMRGEYSADGQINVSKVMPEIEAIIKMAKEEGYNID